MEQKRPSKLNAAKHWMTALHRLIPGESEEARSAHFDGWNLRFPNLETDELLSDLVAEAALSSWLLLRSERHYDLTVAALHGKLMKDWTAKQHHDFQLCERYLTTAQRRLSRHRFDVLHYQNILHSRARGAAGLIRNTKLWKADSLLARACKGNARTGLIGDRRRLGH